MENETAKAIIKPPSPPHDIIPEVNGPCAPYPEEHTQQNRERASSEEWK